MRTKREKHPWIADVDDPRYHYGREDFADMESRAGDSFAMLMLGCHLRHARPGRGGRLLRRSL
jgi:hypothetical protein